MTCKTLPLCILVLAISAAFAPTQAEMINLSCDAGGMLLVIDTGKAILTDKNPFQKTAITVPVTVTPTAYRWHEGKPGAGADYALDKATRRVTATTDSASGPQPMPLSNPQCGKSAVLLPK